MILGHDTSTGQRTTDVRISEDIAFDTMLLQKTTLKGLRNAGFFKPSPVQLLGIPLGKCGFDLLLEAKSGTGKTAVFTVICLEKLDLEKGLQAIILAPTREIASQISEVISIIGSKYKGLNVAVVMGGLSFKEDIAKFKENVHIVVGSPGRLRHLIQAGHIDTSSVRLFVLDEADKLMEKSFLPDINYIFSGLPRQKQVIMSSATYSKETKAFVKKYVQNAQSVCPDSNNVLLGIAQKVVVVPYNSNIVTQTKHRYTELIKIINEKQFKQCLIFCNYQVRVGEIHRMLSKNKWPAEQLYGQQDQTDRLDALKTLQEYKCRILVSTDLAARGIDASNVDIVINFEPPFEWETYLHRIGRAGRYGSYGTAITILSDGKEATKFKEMLTLTNIYFDLHDLWNEEPFNLDQNVNYPEKNEVLDFIPIDNTLHENGGKSQDVLWKVLTTSSLNQDDTKPEISSFDELCNSLKSSSETNIESFANLMQSFSQNQNNTSANIDTVEFKHLKVIELPVKITKKNKLESGSTNKLKDLAKIEKSIKARKRNCNITKKYHNQEPKENERYLTEQMEKHIKNNFTEFVTGSKSLSTFTKNEPLTAKTLFNLINDNKECEQHEVENKCQDDNVGKNERIPTTEDKGNTRDSSINRSMKSEHEIDASQQNEDLYDILEKNKQHTSCDKKSFLYSDSYSESDEARNNPIKQALLDVGLPTAFGKKKQYKNNKNKTHKNYFCDSDDIRKNVEKSKSHQQKTPKILENAQDEDICSNKTFNKSVPKTKNLFNQREDSNLSDSSNERSCHETNSFKLVSDYKTFGTTFKNTYYHNKHTTKESSNRAEQQRSKEFDMWYRQLKWQTQSIQYALYIEELKQL